MKRVAAAGMTLARTPQFDRVARLYRPMEYVSFGPLLERCRFAHLASIAGARRALVLGDGDGRFLARLLAANHQIRAHAVDASSAMLRLLRARAIRTAALTPAPDRLITTCTDIRTFTPPASGYDLVVTHFFLDCLSAAETEQLIARLRPHLAPGALWLVSEFHVPANSRLRAGLARTLISALYAAFRLLTGLQIRRIPPWQSLLGRAGFTRQATRSWLGGLLVSELWQATAPSAAQSHQTMCQSAMSPGPDVPGLDPGPVPTPEPPAVPEPIPAPGPPPEPDPMPYPGPIPAPQPVT